MIIWIASYPKSGNTWVRSFLTSYIYTNENSFDLSKLKYIQSFGQLKHYRNHVRNFDNFNEISNSWMKIQKKINEDNKKIKFFKTHNGLYKVGDSFFTNKKNTLGVIYIVRDPRDIVISASHHFDQDHNLSTKMLFNNQNYESFIENGFEYVRSIVGSWDNHYNSWNSLKEKEKIIIKYEELHKDPNKEFKKILNFISQFTPFEINDNKIKKSIESTNFSSLQNLEKKEGFVEQNKKKTFFRSGRVGEWREKLDKKLVEKIEEKFFKEMKCLGYLNC